MCFAPTTSACSSARHSRERQRSPSSVLGGSGARSRRPVAEPRPDVTVVEFLDWPMERTLGPVMGEWAAGVHRGHGVDMRLGIGVAGARANTGPSRSIWPTARPFAPTWSSWRSASPPRPGGSSTRDSILPMGSASTRRAAPSGLRTSSAPATSHAVQPDVRSGHADRALVERGGTGVSCSTDADAVAEDSVPYSTVPYVWSDQYDAKIQYVGTSGEFHSILEGSTDDLKFVAGYSDGGQLVGALCVNSPARA